MSHCPYENLTSLHLLLDANYTPFVEEIFREFTPEITRYMSPESPATIEGVYDFFRDLEPKVIAGTEAFWIVRLANTGEFLGGCGVHCIGSPHPKFGIWIKKSAHGHGYGYEAVTTAKAWLDMHYTYEYIAYECDERNIGSRKIAERLGGVYAHTYTYERTGGREPLQMEEWRICSPESPTCTPTKNTIQ